MLFFQDKFRIHNNKNNVIEWLANEYNIIKIQFVENMLAKSYYLHCNLAIHFVPSTVDKT